MDEAELQRLHARLVDEDPTASLELVEVYGPHLLNQIRRKWPDVAPELREEAVFEALFGYLGAPTRYHPARGPLGRYLFWCAHRDVQNALDREARQRSPGALSLDRVELGPDGRNESIGERLADPRPAPEPWLDEVDPTLLAEVAAALHDEGERRAEVFAAALGLDTLPLPEQRREVQRVKNRVLKRLQRQVTRGRDGRLG